MKVISLSTMIMERFLDLKNDEHIKYVDVISSGIGMTMVLKVTGGQSAKITTIFMIFQNSESKYSIRRVSDIISGISYRLTASGFMTS
jgi:hypothetical protein